MLANRTLRRIGIASIICIAFAALGVWYLNWMMKQPLYVFGSVSRSENLRGPLTPPVQTDPSSWQVESDITLTFREFGDGKPVLVVHGGPGIPYGNIWKGLEPLTDRYKFYFYHQRGCGNSTRPCDKFDGKYYENMTALERTLGLGAQVADIERIRQILDLEKVTLIGHSFGGFIATLYAAEFPNRVEKLVLVAPAGVLTPPDEERDIFALTRAKLKSEQLAGFNTVQQEYFDFPNIFTKSDAELADLHTRLGEYILNALGYELSELTPSPPSGGWAVFAQYFSCGRAQDYRPALKEVTAPTLIIQGEDDDISLPGSNTYKAIKGSQFVSMGREEPERRAGHFVFDDSPESFRKVIEQFLAE
jgi:proline iminopeptidase